MPSNAEVILPEDINVELLKAVFDAAFMQTSIDQDGDLHVKDPGSIGCFVLPTKSRTRIHLLSLFKTKARATAQDRMAFAHRVNSQWDVVKAIAKDNGGVAFEFDLWVEGGVTKRNVVWAVKQFISTVIDSIKKCDTDDIVE